MSRHRYITNTTNLFEGDDVKDDTSTNSYRPRFPPAQPKPAAPTSCENHKGEMERLQQSMLESSYRSISLLTNTEQIGNAAAEELIHQRVQLDNTNRRLDEMKANLNSSQKNLNGIKSVFYYIKNRISGNSDHKSPRRQMSPDTHTTKEERSTDKLKEIEQPASSAKNKTTAPELENQRVNDVLEVNLDKMAEGVQVLKDLGIKLGEEIDDQNRLLDAIHDKVEGADFKIYKQIKQMDKLSK